MSLQGDSITDNFVSNYISKVMHKTKKAAAKVLEDLELTSEDEA